MKITIRSATGSRQVKLAAWFWIIPLQFIAVMMSTSGALLLPQTYHWTAGTLCEPPRKEMVIVTDTKSSPGKTVTRYSVYCLNAEGQPKPLSQGKVMGLLFAWYSAAAWAIYLLILAAKALRGRDARVTLPPEGMS